MALSSTRAIYNAAVDTLMAAMEVMIEAEPDEEGGQLAFVPIEASKGDHPSDGHWGNDANVVFNGDGVKSYIYMKGWHATTADIPVQIGRHPAFWKITNSLGDV